MQRVNIFVECSEKPHAIAAPLARWLGRNGVEVAIIQADSYEVEPRSDQVNIWALRDDTLGSCQSNNNDISLAAVAPTNFKVLHPAVSISSAISDDDALAEFENCTWMCSDESVVSIAKKLGVRDNRILLLTTREERVAYHTALCIMVPEVFTLFEAGKEVIRKNVKEEKFEHVWSHALSTAKRTTQLYTDNHYHGPVARLDRTTLSAQFTTIKKSTPWILPLYSESIQYRTSSIAVDRYKMHDLGLANYYWDTKSKKLSDTNIDRKKELILEREANEILSDLVSIMPCKPSIASLTFFKLDVSKLDISTSLKGEGFFLSRSKELTSAFKKQINFFLSPNSPEGISHQIVSRKADSLKPFIVISDSLKDKMDFDYDNFFNKVDSIRPNSRKHECTDDYMLNAVGFGEVKHNLVNQKQKDGWFPLDYEEVCELIIPIFRFKSGDDNPLLEGLITIVSPIKDIIRFTPSRISEVQSLALRRYVSLGYVERLFKEYVINDKNTQLESPIRNLLAHLSGAFREVSVIEDIYSPYRFWIADAELQSLIRDLKSLVNYAHDVSNWGDYEYSLLREIWAKHKEPLIKQLNTSFFPDLYNKYFYYFDDEQYSPEVGYIAKALSAQVQVPFKWLVNFSQFKANDSITNKVLNLEHGIPCFPFLICLQSLSEHILSINTSLNNSINGKDNNGALIELKIFSDHRGSNGLKLLRSKIKEIVSNREFTNGLSSKHTSTSIALLVGSAYKSEITFEEKEEALLIQVSFIVSEVL